MSKTLLTLAVTEEELAQLEQYCQQTNRTKTDVIREYIRSIQQRPREKLLSQIAELSRELEEVKQEKSDLEILLETMADHSSTVEAELQDEAEEARRESEERFRSIAEATPVPVTISRVSDGKVLYANAAAGFAFGCSIETLLDRAILELYDDLAEGQKLLETFDRERTVQNYELCCQRADATPFWVTASLRPLRLNGEATILSALYDISDRKQAEQDLQEAKEQLEAVLNAVPGSISWISSEGNYLGVNPYLAQSFDLPPEAFVGRKIGFMPGSEQFAKFIDEFVASPQKSTSQVVEIPVKNNIKHYLMAAQKYQQGTATVLVGIDITERKHAEEALRIAEENYRSIFENALEGIFQSSPEGCYLSVNPAMAKIYGYDSPDEMIAEVTSIDRQIYVDDRDRVQFKQILQEQEKVKGLEYRVYRRDGTIVWVQEDTRVVADRNNRVLYYEGIVQDISERKVKEEELKRQLQELRIEIDHQKREQEVKKITQSDYFRELQSEVANIQADDFWEFEI
ncbi:MAG: PAS domain S-box protein [Cyanobacteria bacterium SID2]|nr:PAS domain S-box protein [Cyanobacteria bacterium SID2]MBP0006574.1 PAS domain S-box protein [Cyanobacteria bacterium SBC]